MSLSKQLKKSQLNRLYLSKSELAELENTESLTANFLSNSYVNYINKIVTAVIVNVDYQNGKVEVDCGLKNNCYIDLTDFEFFSENDDEVDDQNPQKPKLEVGQSVEVMLLSVDSRECCGVNVSREKAIEAQVLDEVYRAYEQQLEVPGYALSNVSGGVFVALRGVLPAFLPGSQIDVRPVKDISAIAGQKCAYRILHAKLHGKVSTIVLSRKDVVAQERRLGAQNFFNTIVEGQNIKGYVKNLTDYGVFVDLGDVDGLVAMQDIAWNPEHIQSTYSNLNVGDEITVRVLKIDHQKQRVSLGIKQITENTEPSNVTDAEVGSIYRAVVKKITKYGCFIETQNGIEGLLHLSEISLGDKGDKSGGSGYNNNILRFIKVGQYLDVAVISVDPSKSRFSFKLHFDESDKVSNPCDRFIKNHRSGDVVSGVISNITSFGLFVTVGDFNEDDTVQSLVLKIIDGLVHNNDIIGVDARSYKVGDTVDVVYISADTNTGKIRLGIGDAAKVMAGSTHSATSSADGAELKEDEVVTCTVIGTNQDGISVELSNGSKYTIKRPQLSKEKTEQRSDRFNIGDRVDAKVIRGKSGSLTLSIREFEEDELQRIIGKYGSETSGATIGNMLREVIAQSEMKSSGSNKNE